MSIAGAALVAAGTIASAPVASAEPAASAASWVCQPTWDDTGSDAGLIVACSYDGTVRGAVAFYRNDEPEQLWADDGATDHRAVIAEATWTQDGRERRSTVRSAGPVEWKEVAVPEGTAVWLRLCLEGHSCGEAYKTYA
ncbi:hypothetical protein [Actinophytocola sediminis]